MIEAFRTAAAESARYITARPDEYRAALAEPTKLDPDLAATVSIPMWSERVDLDSLRFLGAKMASHGVVEQEPDAAAAVYSGSWVSTSSARWVR